MAQDCSQGVDAACDQLSREEEAKRAWLAKLNGPAATAPATPQTTPLAATPTTSPATSPATAVASGAFMSEYEKYMASRKAKEEGRDLRDQFSQWGGDAGEGAASMDRQHASL